MILRIIGVLLISLLVFCASSWEVMYIQGKRDRNRFVEELVRKHAQYKIKILPGVECYQIDYKEAPDQ